MGMQKEPYFTANTIDDKSDSFLHHLASYTKRNLSTFAPKHPALLVLDMQRCFLEESSHAFIPSSLAIVPKIKALMAAFQQREHPVILTRHLNTDQDAHMMGRWWKDIIREEDRSSEIIEAINTPQATAVVKKTQYDAFFKTALADTLASLNVDQLVISGVMTHLCCDTTARSAFMRGYEVFFPVDTTATYNEELHLAAFVNLSHGAVTPLLSETILAAKGNTQ
ncbi:cysteine hydrolase [Oligoflexia bacterium]|nr:cysteine hydrolase [Oligoflexia bacterium]